MGATVKKKRRVLRVWPSWPIMAEVEFSWLLRDDFQETTEKVFRACGALGEKKTAVDLGAGSGPLDGSRPARRDVQVGFRNEKHALRCVERVKKLGIKGLRGYITRYERERVL